MGHSRWISKKFSYAWVIVAVGFIMFTTAFAIQYSFGIFFKPLQDAFGWSRATTSWAMTIHLTVFALCMLPAGWAIDRLNTRIVLSIAAVLISFALILASRVSEAWQLYLLYGLPLGIGISLSGTTTINSMITRWFSEHRGLALGITSTGIGFGTLIGAPISNALITAYGWRNAFIIIGIAAGIILLICANFIKRPSVSYNQGIAASSDNQPTQEPETPSPAISIRQAIRTKDIFLIMLAFGFVTFTIRMVMVHIAPYATDVGISPPVAALAVGLIGGFSILGRLVMGFAQDRIGPQRSMIICFTIQGIPMLALPFIRLDWLFFAYTIVFGFTYGGEIPQIPAITAQRFGIASIGMIYGMINAVASLIAAFGPIIAGYVFDATGSYTIVFLLAAAGIFLAVYLTTRIRLK